MQQSVTENRPSKIDGVVATNGVKRLKAMEIQSRFGAISVQPEKAIFFPHGLPGLPNAVSFCLTEMPNVKNEQFKLLQCMNEHQLSFIVVPSTYENQLLEQPDVDDALAILEIAKDNLLLLYIVTAHETPTGRRLSVNAKAPIFVDAVNRTATQYVFQSNAYEIQHFIS